MRSRSSYLSSLLLVSGTVCWRLQWWQSDLGYIMVVSWCPVRLFAAVIALVGSSGLHEAVAQAKKVAVINLAADQVSGFRAATKIRIELEKSSGFSPLQNGELQRNLEAPLPAEDRNASLLTRAAEALAAGRRELGQAAPNHLRALAAVRDGEARALETPPTDARNVVLADLAFLAGRIHLLAENRGLARSAFELVLRLRSDFSSPDPGQFDPEVVGAFKSARASVAAEPTAALDISATYDGVDVYLDGAPVGKTRAKKIPVQAGTHIVTVYSPDYQVANQKIEVAPGDELPLSLSLVPQKVHDVAMQLRRQAIAADLTTRRDALKGLTRKVNEMTGASYTIIIRGDSRLEVAAYNPDGTLTAFFPRTSAAAGSYVSGLLPGVGVLGPEDLTLPTLTKPRWFERTEWQLGLGGGAIAVIGGAVIFAVAATSSKPGDSTGVLGGFPF